MTTTSSQGSFSRYLDSDPEFEDALCNVVLPGDEVLTNLNSPAANTNIQAPSDRQDEQQTSQQVVIAKKRPNEEVLDNDSDDEVETHLRRKRVKLHSSSQPAASSQAQLSNSQSTKPELDSSPDVHHTIATRTLTSADGAAFIESFYQKSRLHHLSTWKAELKVLVHEAAKRNTTIVNQDQAAKKDIISSTSAKVSTANFFNLSNNQQPQAPAQRDKIIFHVDFDCFFASVGILDRPHLRDKPTVVCHSQVSGGVVSGSVDAVVSEKDLWEGKRNGKKASMSEVSSANYVARAYGIKNGMLLQKAQALCPQLVTIPYEFDKYKRISLQLYSILLKYADDLEAVSVDEAFLDVTSTVKRMKADSAVEGRSVDHANELARQLRMEVKKATGCDVSIGVGQNVLLARIATRFAKPSISHSPNDSSAKAQSSTSLGADNNLNTAPSTSTSASIPPLHTGTFHLFPSQLRTLLTALPLTTLPGVGPAIASKASERLNGATTVGDIMRFSKGELCSTLGQAAGESVFWGARGIEREERKLVGVLIGEVEGGSSGEGTRKSVSADINYGIRFQDNAQVESFMNDLGVEVSRRLNEINVRGRVLTLKVLTRAPGAPVETPKFLGAGHCVTTSRQTSFPGATNSAQLISSHAWGLLKSLNLDPKELRGIGIQITKLESTEGGASEMVQKTLGFKRVDSKKQVKVEEKECAKVEEKPLIMVQPPSSDADAAMLPPSTPPKREPDFDLPSFSQVDRDVLSALPDDVRQELTEEYNRRPVTPTLEMKDLHVPSHDSSKALNEDPETASPKKPTPTSGRKVTDRGTPLSRITQALAPRNRTSIISPYKSKLFSKRKADSDIGDGPSTPRVGNVKVTDTELKKLGFDVEVFRMLPQELQSEQLARARFEKSFGDEGGEGKGKKKA